ncbi:protein maelstrom 2 [Solenopsis invicta]|uniref:protein maelstrom 2 n=1 Tax=Solenopsis invicta TaxID=13686 RepID=UPI000595A876|nr:protein maelstrom 2 [Solenopsis invicta]
MPKAKGRNAFFFFMASWKKREEAKGRKFPNGFKDVQQDPDCNDEWRNLSKPEKAPYEEMAKQDKIKSQISNQDKKTSYGESISMLEQKQKEAELFKMKMQENIKHIVDSAANLNILSQSKFCFVHVNHFFHMIVNNCSDYFPAEYAFGIFSLEKGIEDVHHAIVSAPIPLGYRREAMEESQNSHNIPVEYPGGETNFANMYDDLVKFLECRKLGDKYPYFYTTKKFYDPVQSLISRLCKAANEENQFIIYEMESLFNHLANENYRKRTDRDMRFIPVYAENVFTRYTYIFDKGFECHLHKYIDGGSEWCSKSVLYQWAWTLCDEFCEPLGIEMKSGVHKPLTKPEQENFSVVTNLLSNLKVKDSASKSTPESSAILSMTGVSEQHRIKVSGRTYEDEMRRRKESKPVQIIDYSKVQESTSVDKPKNSVDKSVKTTIEENTKNVPNYLNEKPMRPPNIEQPPFLGCAKDFLLSDDESFPPIGGRGVSIRSRINTIKKAPLGKGQGHT